MKRIISTAILLLGALAIGCGEGAKAPPTPGGLAATATTGQVSLTWTAAAKATSYNLYYATASGVTTATGTRISGITAASYQHTSVTNGSTYYYVVTALNKRKESAASAEASATPLAVPTGITATAGAGQVSLAWNAVTGAASYNIYFSTTAGVTTANGTKVSGITGTSYIHTGLTNGSTYHYVITAVAAHSESTASSESNATPAATPPVAPTGLAAVPADGQVALTWAAVSGAVDYNLYYGTASGITTSSPNKVLHLTGTNYSVSGLVNGTLYYFVVTAENSAGESAISNEANATPTNGITVKLTPGTATSATLQVSSTVSLTFNFAANAVGQSTIVTITPVTQSNLPVPMVRSAMFNRALVPSITANGTYIVGLEIGFNPATIINFNVPILVTGTLGNLIPQNSTINLALLVNNLWSDTATFVVGGQGDFIENIASVALPGLLDSGWYLLYLPPPGGNTSVSNLGVVLSADDGYGMSDSSGGLQVIHLYDATGNLLATPVVNLLDYPEAYDLDGSAMTPDGSQGIMVDGGNTVRLFSAVQTGTPVASTSTLDVSTWGGDGDSIAILPNGDEAVVSEDSSSQLLIVSGILSGSPVVASTIPLPDDRDGLVMSGDGTVMLARGYYGLEVFSVTPITPVPGPIGGTVAHQYTEVTDIAELGTDYIEDGRDGMAISPTDSTRAVVVLPDDYTVHLITGLTTTPVVGAGVSLGSAEPLSVSITPDGKLAVVGTSQGLAMFSGVDTGTLVQVGSLYAPTYTARGTTRTLGYVSTLGITLDGKYVTAGDSLYYEGQDGALVVIPISSSGFGAVAEAIPITVGDNDQFLIH